MHEKHGLGTKNEIDRSNKYGKDFINFNGLLNENRNGDEQVWVGVSMAKPGRHQYVVRYEDDPFDFKADESVGPLGLIQ